MTRFIHDQFAKDYLEELLKPYGEVQAPSRVAGEVRQIDVLFSPSVGQNTNLEVLGLLGRFAETPAILEPYRNAASSDEICDCLLKLLEVRGRLQREANRNETFVQESEIPKLWILTPTASANLLSSFRAIPTNDWLPGVHFLADALRTAIVAIHQLPVIPETLWLRILGRGKVQGQAIDELQVMPANHPFRKATLELVYNLRQNLRVNQNLEPDDQELIMRLEPLYQQDRERAVQEGQTQGIKQGEQRLVIRLLNRRFGEIDLSLIERVQELPVEQIEGLAEALLDFSSLTDLETWLNQQ
ncbi:DUF4351 domain-containing protein [Nostoc favosum]|uniref:DUF4351 domain-containing protein n=1 Tax=Nostoc favosum CHAB5714 TaxID=2780399 RepID=A0ABS8I9S9_9NOSO|nr:DUF4351 domain-containing protein [Nostoc favosum]MCC5600855.1 DUF4351 domain-containing protein [Nostoc favosum CHAB5714]